MSIRLGEFVVGFTRLSLYQDKITGQIYHTSLSGKKEPIIPLPNGKVKAAGQPAVSISPPLPSEALEAIKAKRTARNI